MFEGPNKRQKILVLLTMCFALFMAMLDNTVVNVALPTLSRELGAGVSGLQWIVDGYVLAFGSLLLTGGILGDRYGRKRMFMGGLAVFALASLLSGLSQTTGQLIGFRVLQGVGAALLMPGTLSILTVTFPDHERAKAIGIWAGVSGIALALGPTAGGWLVEHVAWQAVFFLNVPIGIAGLVVASRVVKESRSEVARRLDIPGLALGTLGLFAVTYALIEANELGWSHPGIVGSLVGAGLLLTAFLVWESRTDHAMLPVPYFRLPAFSAGIGVAFAVSLGMFGTFFFFSLYMQFIRGYSPFEAGIRFLPMTLMIVLVAPQAGRLAQRFGSRWPMTAGLTLAATGLLLISRAGIDTPFALLLPVLMMMGGGMAMTMTPMTAAVMASVGPQRAGMGSAMTNTAREVGGVFGIALLGTLLTTRLRSTLADGLGGLGLPESLQTSIVESGGHGRLQPELLTGLEPQQQAAVRDAFGTAFLSGFSLSLVIAAGVLYVGALAAARWIPSAPRPAGAGAAPAAVPSAPKRPPARSNGRRPAARKPGAALKPAGGGRKPAAKPSKRKPTKRKPPARR